MEILIADQYVQYIAGDINRDIGVAFLTRPKGEEQADKLYNELL
jgi:hypothetical protein